MGRVRKLYEVGGSATTGGSVPPRAGVVLPRADSRTPIFLDGLLWTAPESFRSTLPWEIENTGFLCVLSKLEIHKPK